MRAFCWLSVAATFFDLAVERRTRGASCIFGEWGPWVHAVAIVVLVGMATWSLSAGEKENG